MVKELVELCPNSIKIVKSTVLPSVLEKLEKIEPSLVYNPEFLREKNANLDFVNSDMIIFGGNRNTCSKVSDAYLKHSRCKTKEHIFTNLKLLHWSNILSTPFGFKGYFFNELFAIFERLNVSDSWESLVDIISRDKRISDSHMNVPGHDGRKGFGGACFPKDSLALVKYAESNEIDLKLLKSVIKINNKIRSDYSDLDSRESEQNVSFDDKI